VTRPATPTLRYRLGVASRTVAACVGGYAAAALAAILLGAALPMTPMGAAVTSTLVGILVVPVAAMACFYARSAARAWIGILVACALFGGAALAAGWRP
jgi:hypothetical protein